MSSVSNNTSTTLSSREGVGFRVNSELKFTEVLPSEFTRKPTLVRVRIARFRASDGSRVMKALPPIAEEYRHLKRVRKAFFPQEDGGPVLEIVLGSIESFGAAGAELPPSLRELALSFGEADVSKHEAVTPSQLAELGKFWPLTYRRPAFQPLDVNDKSFVSRLEKNMRPVLANPETCCIVFPPPSAVPLSKSAGVADLGEEEPPAKRVRIENSPPVPAARQNSDRPTGVSGVSSGEVLLPRSVTGHRNHAHPLKHATIDALDKVGQILCGDDGGSCDSRRPGDEEIPYLCVDAEVYLQNEPCVMCAMALVHSRVRMVVFAKENPDFGGFGGRVALQQEKKLNHQVRVLRCQNKNFNAGEDL